MQDYKKIDYSKNKDVVLRYIPGHFVTPNSHVNYYMAYLANKLTKAGMISANAHKTIYITSTEYNTSGQMMFRENNQHMIKGKRVLVLIDTATTGETLRSALRSVRFYGGTPIGISAIYSVAAKIDDIPIRSLYSTADLPDYAGHNFEDCPLCKAGIPIDAICNGYGYSTL